MSGAMMDSTPCPRSEQALQESEERPRKMADAIKDVFYLSDAKTNEIIYINPAFTRIWGRQRREILKRPRAWLEMVHPDDRERVERSLDNWKPEGKTPEWNEEYRIVRPDGSISWRWTRAIPVRDASGALVRF